VSEVGNYMASCVRNICIKNYQNLIIGFQVTVDNVGNVLLRQCTYLGRCVTVVLGYLKTLQIFKAMGIYT